MKWCLVHVTSLRLKWVAQDWLIARVYRICAKPIYLLHVQIMYIGVSSSYDHRRNLPQTKLRGPKWDKLDFEGIAGASIWTLRGRGGGSTENFPVDLACSRWTRSI